MTQLVLYDERDEKEKEALTTLRTNTPKPAKLKAVAEKFRDMHNIANREGNPHAGSIKAEKFARIPKSPPSKHYEDVDTQPKICRFAERKPLIRLRSGDKIIHSPSGMKLTFLCYSSVGQLTAMDEMTGNILWVHSKDVIT